MKGASIDATVTSEAHSEVDGSCEAEALIQIRGLSKRYGTTTALASLDLDIHSGQFLVLLGPSGCGKTTTMRSLVGLERPDSGSIRVDGRVLFDFARAVDVPPNKRDMGMVFQSYALWPHKSVFGNVAFPLQMRRRAKKDIRDAVADALETVGLPGFEDRAIATLSGGQMQRIALARSLAMRPKIMLLDEPLSNLDAQLRVRLRHELKEIQQSTGITFVYVTHDLDEALGLADHVVVMNEGRIAQAGPPEAIYARPRTAFVAGFLGIRNQFAVELTNVQGGYATMRLRDFPITMRSTDWDFDATPTDRIACVRPEGIRLTAGSGSSTTTAINSWPGIILSSQFQGQTVRYHAQVTDGPSLFCDAPATEPWLRAGDSCTVEINPGRVLLLQDAIGGAEH